MIIEKEEYSTQKTLRTENSYETFKLLAENSFDIVNILTEDGTIVFESNATKRILGYEAGERIGKNTFEFVHPEDIPMIVTEFQSMVAEPYSTKVVEFRFKHKNGSWIWLQTSGQNFLLNPHINGIIINSRDITEGKKIKDELIKAKEDAEVIKLKFESYFNFATERIFISDEFGNYIEVNPAASIITGYTVDELLKKNILDIIPTSELELAQEQLKNLMNNGECSCELHFEKKDKSIGFWIVNATKISNNCYLAFTKEITQRKQAEQALQYSEEIFRSIIENNPDAILLTDTDGSIIQFNQALENMLKIPSSQLLHKKIWDVQYKLLPQEKQTKENFDKYVAMLQDVYSGEKDIPVLKSKYLICVENTDIYIQQIIFKIKTDKGFRIASITRDITALELSYRLLKQSEAKNAAILSAIPDMLFIQNTEGVYVDFYLPENTITFSPPKVYFGQKMENIFPQNIATEFIPLVKKVIETHKMQQFEYSLSLPDKEHFYEARIIDYETDKVLSIVRDITERKETELLINQKNRELQKINSDKDRFISILAHDLKNPFFAIIGFLDLLSKNIRKYDIEKIEYQIHTVNTSAKNTYLLLENILTWIKTHAGKIPFEKQATNLKKVVLDVIQNIELSANNKNIVIYNKVPHNIFVFVDINMIQTVLRNLISNAIKFTHKNGIIEISSEVNQMLVTVSVSDNGVGIKQENIDKIFNISKIYRTAGTENETGTGFGLIICKEFVEKHGGDIWVESEYGKGSIFKFTTPISFE